MIELLKMLQPDFFQQDNINDLILVYKIFYSCTVHFIDTYLCFCLKLLSFDEQNLTLITSYLLSNFRLQQDIYYINNISQSVLQLLRFDSYQNSSYFLSPRFIFYNMNNCLYMYIKQSSLSKKPNIFITQLVICDCKDLL